MNNPYKDALQHIQKNKYMSTANLLDASLELYPVDWTYNSGEEVLTSASELSEKGIVLESFTQFAHEKISEKENSAIKDLKIEMNGAQVKIANKVEKASHTAPKIADRELIAKSNELIGKIATDLRYNNKENVRVMFVSDFVFTLSSDEQKNERRSEFDTLFQGNISHLFSRMVAAMKINEQEFFLSAVGINANGEETKNSFQEQLIQEVLYFEPEVIITLGVTATHGLMKVKDRLKEIHGQFLDLTLNDKKFVVMPLFSPHLLGSAPNMKKIAWEDLQKVMEKLSLKS